MIDRGLDPGPGVDEDLFDLPADTRARRGIAPLPRSLEAAANAQQGDAVVCAVLGEVATAELLRLHRAEAEDWVDHVSGWERARYATAF